MRCLLGLAAILLLGVNQKANIGDDYGGVRGEVTAAG